MNLTLESSYVNVFIKRKAIKWLKLLSEDAIQKNTHTDCHTDCFNSHFPDIPGTQSLLARFCIWQLTMTDNQENAVECLCVC